MSDPNSTAIVPAGTSTQTGEATDEAAIIRVGAPTQDTAETEDVKEYPAKLLAANVKWAERMNQTFPQYFPEPKERQAPKVLWLGCSDSLVHESDAMAALPGTAFVHRNIANQFNPKDDNALSVLMYAVNQLGIQHIVIVGHEHCAGVNTAMAYARRPPSVSSSQTSSKSHHWYDKKLQAVGEAFHTMGDLFQGHSHKHEHHESQEEVMPGDPNLAVTRWVIPLGERLRKVVLPADQEAASRIATEENVKMQVENLVNMGEFVHRLASKKPVWVHGWVYDTSTGFIQDLQVTKVIC